MQKLLSDLHTVLELLQLLQWLFLCRNKFFHVVPGSASRENIPEHAQCCIVRGCLLVLADALSNLGFVDEDLRVPETILGACSEEGVRLLHRGFFDKKIFPLLLLQSVKQCHRLVRLCQVVFENFFVVKRCIFEFLKVL